MDKDQNFIDRMKWLFLGDRTKTIGNESKTIPTNDVVKDKKVVTVPGGRVSKAPSADTYYGDIASLTNETVMVKPDFSFDSIPVIRQLYKSNEDVGSTLLDLIQLTNTGHVIKFDNSVDPDLVDKMRKHIESRSRDWGSGVAGIHGIINKLIAQIWIGGALSAEIVPLRGITGIDNIIIVDPETIRFKLRKMNGRYQPYQMLKYFSGFKKNFVKLNPVTYKYYGMYRHTDNPYGVPPFLTALRALSTQGSMRKNIDHIMKQMGLLGYLEVKVAKPDQDAGENEEAYKARLNKFLLETKENVTQGFLDGTVVGYDEDHEFDFHSTTKNLNGIPELFNQNENQIANGLKTSGTFLGLSGSGTEQMLSIVFTKMLSQLKNVQIILTTFLQELYTLELLMAGYNFKSIHVEFKPSTITDDLKNQQSREIKQRVLHNLWVDGIIGQDSYADGMSYEKYDRVVQPPEPGSDPSSVVKKEKVEKDKDKSDRKSRDKSRSQPKRKDRQTKER